MPGPQEKEHLRLNAGFQNDCSLKPKQFDPAMHSAKYHERVTSGEIAPQYEDIRYARNKGLGQPVATSRPWWNPRYWTRKIWIAVVAVVVIVVVVIIAVAVTVTKKNAYPDYSPLTYNLQDTCEYYLLPRRLS